MLETRFTSLVGCRLPLQQAGMGAVAMAPLVLAVAEAGGLGMLGGVMLPPPVLAGVLDDLAARTRGAFGVNFLMPFLDRDAVPIAATRARRRVLLRRTRSRAGRRRPRRRRTRMLAGRLARGGDRRRARGLRSRRGAGH